MTDSDPSYIDYETFLSPDFSPSSFANTLVTTTNNITDTPLDLSTPLSRVLFDLQEIDTHIHSLTTKSALPLFEYTTERTDAADKVLREVEGQVRTLTEGYERLERDVLRRWEGAEEVRVAAERAWATLRLGRGVGRCLVLGRQLEGQLAEVMGRNNGEGKGPSVGAGGREDHRAMVRAATTLLYFRRLFSATSEEDEGYGLDRVKVIRTLRSDLVIPAENTIKSRAQQIITKFSMSTDPNNPQQPSSSTYAQLEESKSRLTSALHTLYLLSPSPPPTTTPTTTTSTSTYIPTLLLSTLQSTITTSLNTSLASLSRSLSILPTLDRTLSEISTRCQTLLALESILESTKPPAHPFLAATPEQQQQEASTSSQNLLSPLLTHLDTSSLASYFWRSLASSLSPRVQEIISKGGVSARTLKSNRERLREELRGCVLRGSQIPGGLLSGSGSAASSTATTTAGNWEREAAVMVGAVVGVLGR
ncbi:hypothetical protein FQN54_009407 [Arachnomyces sp. PD_36]|nr:hypothetical protein FQN54_009407 [Arachnomyces sp. PD_36]